MLIMEADVGPIRLLLSNGLLLTSKELIIAMLPDTEAPHLI
jgi:hypothetical protein